MAVGAYVAPAFAAPSLSEQGCPGDGCTATYTADGPTHQLIVGNEAGSLTLRNTMGSPPDWAIPAVCTQGEDAFKPGQWVITCPGGRYRSMVLNVASFAGAKSEVNIDSAFESVTFNGGADRDDLVVSQDANVVAYGNDGDDSLQIFPNVAGTDRLYGGAGLDRLHGSLGDDLLDGGPGDDLIGPAGLCYVFCASAEVDFGADTIIGGEGVDTKAYQGLLSERASGVSVTFDGVANDGEPGEGDNVHPDVENATGTAHADRLIGTAAANVLSGGAGSDRIEAGAGPDELLGDGEYGPFLGDEAGDDHLDAGPGRDTVVAHGGNDRVLARDGQPDDVNCGDGTDTAELDPPNPRRPTDEGGRSLSIDFGFDEYAGRVDGDCETIATGGSTGGALLLRRLRLRPVAFRPALRGGPVASAARRGTRVSYRLSTAGTVRFTVQRKLRGRWKRQAGSFKRRSRKAGGVSFRFTGRLAKRALSPGRYRLVAKPRSKTAQVGKTVRAAFRILP